MADESTETNSQHDSPSVKKFSSMVMVKSPEKCTSSESSPNLEGTPQFGSTRIESSNTCLVSDFQQPMKNTAPKIVVENDDSSNFDVIMLNDQNANVSDNEDNVSGYQSTDF